MDAYDRELELAAMDRADASIDGLIERRRQAEQEAMEDAHASRRNGDARRRERRREWCAYHRERIASLEELASDYGPGHPTRIVLEELADGHRADLLGLIDGEAKLERS